LVPEPNAHKGQIVPYAIGSAMQLNAHECRDDRNVTLCGEK